MNLKKQLQPKNLFLGLIILVSIFKITLINKGFFNTPDEMRYFTSGEILKQLSQFNFYKSIELLYTVNGRPAEALVKIIPNILQYISSIILDYKQYEIRNSFLLFFFNILIFSLILIIHYRFSFRFLKNKTLSLFSVLVFSTLVASYISLRHSEPYDLSLLILYFIFYKILDIKNQNYLRLKNFFYYGFIAFFGYCCYPGYIMLFLAIPISYFLISLKKDNLIMLVKQLTSFTFGSILCLLFFELLAQTVNKSFIKESIVLSKTIIQGSFEECFSFLFKYLIEVERFTGIFIIIGLILFCIQIVIKYFKLKKINDLQIIFIILFLIFISYSILGFYFHKVVWYARLLKQFIPFIILFSISSLQYLFTHYRTKNHYKYYILYGFSLLFLFNFHNIISEYKTYFYPKDVIWSYYNSNENVQFHLINEYSKNLVDPLLDDYFSKGNPIHAKKYICTYGSIYPFDNLSDYHIYTPKENEKLIFSKPIYYNFKGYQFEGSGIKARANLDKVTLNVKVYEVKR